MKTPFQVLFREFLPLAGILLVALACLLGCARWAARDSGPGIDAWEYRNHCGACHKLPKPKSKSDEEWRQFILDHRLVTGQDEDTAELFVDYLQRMN
ncbi:MAG: hypothetical protein GHCLOJNM_03601 [bacterium]|nr:hypothetical protein [bacterium]